MEVPNPLVVPRADAAIIAFNLADVWVLAGCSRSFSVIGVWLVRNRDALPPRRRRLAALTGVVTRRCSAHRAAGHRTLSGQ